MSATQIRIPKSVFKGFGPSFGVFIVASIVMYLLARYIPISPIAQIMDFMHLNHNSPAVVMSSMYRRLEPQASDLDSLILTPIVMLLSGAMLGVYARRNSMNTASAAIFGAISGFVLTMLLLVFNYVATGIVLQLTDKAAWDFNASNINPRSLTQATIQIVLSTAAYALGVWLVARKPLAATPAVPSNRRSAARAKAV